VSTSDSTHELKPPVHIRWSLMRPRVLIVLALLCCIPMLDAADENRPDVTITDDGTIVVPDCAEIPAYSPAGKWVEGKEKSSERFFTRHFLFEVPDKPPVLELFVTRYLVGEPSDGVFESALVNGYISAFARGAGFQNREPVYQDWQIGQAKTRRCVVQLSNGSRTMWVYAYIYARTPSLVFLSVRAEPDGSRSIERYLATVRLK